ncbi:ImmA/IrrE family metallo-endopeptidase [Vibrio rarus]|uniref:ImmA/IrrE family metallo-endopeptidase n=1 Tax=Vibrio rarus TaxID=413403 RepID=UPI0021C3A4F6|nr:ImmA/IrrE family metallo-endopeptidase [Vibrio rarus]
MSFFKVIKNDSDHQAALSRLMDLMNHDYTEGTTGSDELEVLGVLIEQYESNTFPIELPTPLEAVKFEMDQRELSRKDMQAYFGPASRVSEILNGKRAMSAEMLRKLHHGLGISGEVLLQEQSELNLSQPEIQYAKFPLRQMSDNGYFTDSKHHVSSALKDLKEYAEDLVKPLLDSFGVIPERALLKTAVHGNSAKAMDPNALSAWFAIVHKKSLDERLECKYEKSLLTDDFMKQLASLSTLNNGAPLAKEKLNNIGIHLVIEKHLPKTYLDGAAFMSKNNHPIIALTLRYDREDNFWFTLMHELYHVKLHLNKDEVFYDDTEQHALELDSMEKEADDSARETLIPSSLWREIKPALVSPAHVQYQAKLANRSPSILAGRFRKEDGNYRTFARLIGQGEVRKHFKFT